MGDITDRFRGSDDVPANWQEMQMFLGNRMASDDPRLTLVYDNFHRNLAGICDVAKRSPAAVILATVAVNLRDCPPLASLHRPDLSPEALGRWQKLYASGAEAASRRDWADALVRWEEAAEIDDGFAELQYRLGECCGAQPTGRGAKHLNWLATWTLFGLRRQPHQCDRPRSGGVSADRMSAWPMPNAFSRRKLALMPALEKSSSTNTCISRSRATISWRERFSSK